MRSWTDYLKAHLHPRSVSLLPGVWAGVAEWSGYGHGQGALASEEAREDALDRIRAFAEECDSLQVNIELHAHIKEGGQKDPGLCSRRCRCCS